MYNAMTRTASLVKVLEQVQVDDLAVVRVQHKRRVCEQCVTLAFQHVGAHGRHQAVVVGRHALQPHPLF